jgi:hypothetical protein
MFGMQAIYFCAQRGILYFIHQAPPFIKEQLHISPSRRNGQVQKGTKVTLLCGIHPENPSCVTAITLASF